MSTTNTATGLFFSFAGMLQEVTNMASIASEFLDEEHDAQGVIRRWREQLRQFQTSPPGSTYDWEIPKKSPIRTKLSIGKYERDGNGEHSVYGTISSIWEIAIPAASGRTSKKHTRHENFEVIGKASTRVCVFAHRAQGDDDELARWRFEIGNSDSPGCHFHAQILGEVGDKIFPSSMSVPRLPSMLFTPMDALEFVLAELFQNEWAQHVARETDPIRNWAGCQKDRLIKLLEWQQKHLRNNSGSPWTSLKAAKPDARLLFAMR